MDKRRHVFISHHHADDAHLANLTVMLKRNGYDLRNSSIRAKPSNQARLERKQIPERTLKRLLRMKVSWAGAVIVLIGKDTHRRPWVDWEIRKANELGKRIVGIYERGGTKNDLPAAFDDYGSALVNWNSNSLMDAVDGTDSPFENPDGQSREPVHEPQRKVC